MDGFFSIPLGKMQQKGTDKLTIRMVADVGCWEFPKNRF